MLSYAYYLAPLLRNNVKFASNTQTMQEKLLAIINSIKKNKFEELLSEITPEQKLREDLNFDSFDLAELTVKIEEEFGVDIFEHGLVNSVNEIFAKL